MIWPPRRKASENGLEQVGAPFPSCLRLLSLRPPPPNAGRQNAGLGEEPLGGHSGLGHEATGADQ